MELSSIIKGVNILDPKQLLQYAQDTTEGGRARLAKAVSHFFEETQLSDVEERLASEILINLLRQAETDLKEALSERLATLDCAPSELIIFLANEQISVARPVLLHSPVLNDVDLMYIITSKGFDHWRSIAQRERLSPFVADKLVDTEDTGTILNLLDNQRAQLQHASVKKIARVALRSEELQAPLLRRPEVSADVAVDLYMVVSDALRREITQRFNVQPHVIEQAVEGIVHELSAAAKGARETTPEMLALAKKFQDRGDISPDLMIRTLRRGQVGFFIALFAEKTGIPAQSIVKLIQKDAGKPFVVACRSLGMMKSEFASIFLLSRGIRTGDKIVDQRELAMALKYFDAIREFDVQRIMQSWIKNPDLI